MLARPPGFVTFCIKRSSGSYTAIHGMTALYIYIVISLHLYTHTYIFIYPQPNMEGQAVALLELLGLH